jgi:Ca2+-binding EF-hand superfamily protein
LERLGFAGRQTEAKAQFGRRAAGPDAAATLANTQARVAQTLAEEEANMTRPLVIPTPVDVGIHFRTTTQEAHQFWNPDEYRGAGNNADFSTNAVTVYSMPNVGADGGAGGWKPIKSDLETNHLGQTVPSTYVPSSLEGMRISRRAKSVQEIMQEKMAVREAKLAAGLQGSNRHLRTTYRSDFVKKHPAPEIVVDETRLDNAKMALHETIRKPEANPRDTKNSAYGSQGPLARVRLSEQEELLERLREALRASGLSNLPTLSAVFKAADASRSQSLEPDELVSVLQGFGIRVSTAQLRELWPYFDRDGSGAVDLVEFLRAVKGSLSEHRLRLVHLAFDKIDVDKNGYLDTFEMARFYDAANDPQVKAGRKKEAQVVREFLSVFDGGAKDGIVTKDEFVDYYTGVSALTDSDETFEGILRASWKMNFKLFNRKKY